MAHESTTHALPNGAGGGLDLHSLRRDLERTVRAVCPPWMQNDRDDLVQKTMLRLMRRAEQQGEETRFNASYLRRTAHSVLVDEIRGRRRRREVSLEGDDEREHDRPAPVADPEQVSTGKQIGKAIRGCLTRLLEPRRLAVTLYLQDHSVPEAARLMGWKPKRAENLLYRGLADLRTCLRRKGLEP